MVTSERLEWLKRCLGVAKAALDTMTQLVSTTYTEVWSPMLLPVLKQSLPWLLAPYLGGSPSLSSTSGANKQTHEFILLINQCRDAALTLMCLVVSDHLPAVLKQLVVTSTTSTGQPPPPPAAAAAAAAADAPQPSSGRELVVRPIVGVLRSELQPIISIPLVDDPSSTFSSSLDTGVSVSVRAGDVESITSSRYVAIGLHCLVQLLQQKDTTLWLTPFLDDIMEIACALKRFQSPAGPLFWEVVEAVLCSGSRGDDDTQVAMPMAVDGGDTAAEEGANGAAAAPAAMDM